eukprot:289723-Chlamydomonas_euryale.AAC.1
MSLTQVAWLLARKRPWSCLPATCIGRLFIFVFQISLPFPNHAYMPGVQLQEDGCLLASLHVYEDACVLPSMNLQDNGCLLPSLRLKALGSRTPNLTHDCSAGAATCRPACWECRGGGGSTPCSISAPAAPAAVWAATHHAAPASCS